MKNRSKNDDDVNVVSELVSDKAPEVGNLLHAKSCGYFGSVFALDSVLVKDRGLSDTIQLYFTIHIQCKYKIMTDSVRAKLKVSSNDRALHAKLAKRIGICITLISERKNLQTLSDEFHLS